MSTSHVAYLDERILVLAPIGRDAPLACELLAQAGLRGEICDGLEDLCRKIEDGTGAILVAEEALVPSGLPKLLEVFSRQPPWSAIPMVMLTRRITGAGLQTLRTLERLPKVVFLERPVRIMTLISALRGGLETRRRQYQVRDLLQELERGVRHRDAFLAMLGHELRNPLTPIRTVVDILKLQNASTSEYPLAKDKLQWAIGVIDRQSKQLTHLVDDLLDVARVTQGRITLRNEIVGVAEIVSDSVEIAKPHFDARDHELILSLPSDPVAVRGDKDRLVQVLVNLLHNAAKYTEKGGRIWLSVRELDGEAVISVRDTGIGISAETLPHLFGLFTQASNSLARSQGGLGLGLALVSRLIEMHNGRVQAYSKGLGQGSEFTVWLPILSRDAQQHSVSGSSTAPAGDGADRRILLVDDNEDIARSVATLLEAMGYKVRIAHDSDAALHIARRFRPQAALLDIGLPNMDGYELAEHLRREHGPNSIRLIAMTGYGSDEDVQRAKDAGFVHHLKKPASVEDLLAVLESDYFE